MYDVMIHSAWDCLRRSMRKLWNSHTHTQKLRNSKSCNPEQIPISTYWCHEAHQDRSDRSLSDNVRQEGRTFFLRIVLKRQHSQSIFFCLSNTTYPSSSRGYSSTLSTDQMRNPVWPNTQCTTCCRKILLRNPHGVKSVSYLKNKKRR